MGKDSSGLWRDIGRIRADAPLVHNITNYVAMNSTANTLLAVGASPVMAHAVEEVEEMAVLARALVLNIGTLSAPWIEAMARAGHAANRAKVPVIFDPVGSGATRMRTAAAMRILDETAPAVVRGNASEIASLAGSFSGTKGVDSTRSSEGMAGLAQALSKKRRCVVVVSGATDIIANRGALAYVRNGHPMMARVTGMGCAATALIGAFASVNPSPFEAAVHGMALMGIVGELAAQGAAGPGSLQVRFFDALYGIKKTEVSARMRVTVRER